VTVPHADPSRDPVPAAPPTDGPPPVPVDGAPLAGPPWPPPLPGIAPHEGRRSRTVLVAGLVALVVAGAGLGLGYVWQLIAPRVGVIRVAEGFVYADAEPEQAVAADAWFGFLGVGAGVVLTVLAWVLLRRYRGVAMLIALVLGSLAGAWLAWWLGVRLGAAQFDAVRATAAIGERVNAPLGLRLTDLDRNELWPPKVTGVATAQAFAAAITYTMLAGFSAHPSLRGPDPILSLTPYPLPQPAPEPDPGQATAPDPVEEPAPDQAERP
jgi:MFS family permease